MPNTPRIFFVAFEYYCSAVPSPRPDFYCNEDWVSFTAQCPVEEVPALLHVLDPRFEKYMLEVCPDPFTLLTLSMVIPDVPPICGEFPYVVPGVPALSALLYKQPVVTPPHFVACER
jgi:hypothetical protein